MHIHALIDTLQSGGAENLLLDFAAGAREVGIETTVGYLNGSEPIALDRLASLGIEPVLTPVTGIFNRAERSRLRAEIARIRPDVVHTHLGTSDYVGSLAARSLGIPAVSTLHSAAARPAARQRLRERLVARVRRKASARVIAVSEAARRHYLSYGWERPERVVRVYNGIIVNDDSGEGPRIREELGLGADELVLATVSILKPGKGHHVAIDLVAELRRRGFPARLLVLGVGPLRGEIDEHLARLDGVGMTIGHRDDVSAVLDAVDVLIHPSEQDAFPGALLEAMAARVPAVATDVGGIPEIVIDGETGLLAPAPPSVEGLIDPVQRLAESPELRERLAVAGRARLDANFTVDAWLQRLLPIYEDVIAGRPPAAISESSPSSAGT